MTAADREAVFRRAAGYCEYCGLHRDESYVSFHVEHVIAQQHGGSEDLDNLALSCRRCNLYKGPNISGLDPETGRLTPLFNPRLDRWGDHFENRGGLIVGLTPEGRATVRLLRMNDAPRSDLRVDISDDLS